MTSTSHAELSTLTTKGDTPEKVLTKLCRDANRDGLKSVTVALKGGWCGTSRQIFEWCKSLMLHCEYVDEDEEPNNREIIISWN